MNSVTEQKGSCLCGSVRFVATPKTQHIRACHCDMCRKWGGGPFFAADCDDNVLFEGTEHITTYDSSEWAERGFCKKCGSHLFYRLKQGGLYAIPVGLFDTNDWQFTEQVFIEKKPAFYSFAQETNNLTGAEEFARYSAE